MSPTTTAYQRLLDALHAAGSKIVKSGGKTHAQCPAHDDQKPSMVVTPIEGRVLIHCHSGCDPHDIVAAVKLELADLFDHPSGQAYQYPYRTVYRTPDKTFRQSGNTGIWDLYRLDRVLASAEAGDPVYLVEGEQDVHSMEAMGVTATTAPQGVDGFRKVNVSPLKGVAVIAIPDQDAAGQKWAAIVRERLAGFAASLSFAAPAAGKDPTDHLARGFGLADFTVSTEEPTVEEPEVRRVILTKASQFKIRPVRWGWAHRMPIGEITIIPGREGVGKSMFLAWLAAQITRGTLPGVFEGEPRAVLYVASEDSWEYTVAARMMAAQADLDLVYRIHVEDPGPSRLVLPLDCARIAAAAQEVNAAALMLDPIVSLVDERISPNQSFELRRALEPLRFMAEETGLMVPALVHFNKARDADVLSMIPGGRAWAEVARAGFALAKDEDEDHCVGSTIKNNLGRMDLPHLTYEIEEVFIQTDHGDANVGRLVWTGESEVSAADLVENRRKKGGGDKPGPDSDVGPAVLAYITEQGRAMPVKEITEHFPDVPYKTVANFLKRAHERGELTNPVRGHYGPAWADDEDEDEDVA